MALLPHTSAGGVFGAAVMGPLLAVLDGWGAGADCSAVVAEPPPLQPARATAAVPATATASLSRARRH
jgi:hypothetical protein